MLVSVEVQDEERPTHPALLRSSTSHTPYSNDTSGSPTTTLLLECVYECWIERGEWRPFYSLKDRFPRESDMGTLGTALGG